MTVAVELFAKVHRKRVKDKYDVSVRAWKNHYQGYLSRISMSLQEPHPYYQSFTAYVDAGETLKPLSFHF
jgi:hypothetical protein